MTTLNVVVAAALAATSTLAFAGEANNPAATERSAGTGVYHTASAGPETRDAAREAPRDTSVVVLAGDSRVLLASRGEVPSSRRISVR